MIVQFFNRGKGGGSGPIGYLLGKELDREQAELLRGHPDETAAIIDSSQYAKKYTAGCLSFEESDITPEQKTELMDSFEECLFAGLDRDQYNCLWVQHQDKGRLELNFVIPNIELLSGKRLQPYYYEADSKRIDAWRTMQNIKHGFTDPDDPSKRQTLTHAKDLPKSAQEAQEAITDGLMSLALAGQLKNRADVLKTLENAGFEISRTTDSSISIKNPETGGRNIRLKGALYEQNFRFSQELSAELTARSEKHRATSQERYTRASQSYLRGIEAKRAENNRRHPRPADTHEPRSIQALSVELGRHLHDRAGTHTCIEHGDMEEKRPTIRNPRADRDGQTSPSPTGRQNKRADTQHLQNTDRGSSPMRSDPTEFGRIRHGQNHSLPTDTAEPQIERTKNDRDRERTFECIREHGTESQANNRQANERLNALGRTVASVRSGKPEIERADSTVKRNTERNHTELKETGRIASAAERNYGAANQAIEKQRQAERQNQKSQTKGWGLSY